VRAGLHRMRSVSACVCVRVGVSLGMGVGVGVGVGMMAVPCEAFAQGVEFAPFVGYRVGGGPGEGVPVSTPDIDAAASVGAAYDVPLHDGLWLEIFYSRQAAHLLATVPGEPPARLTASTEYWHAGGLQELDGGTVRPFLTGTVGLTRMAVGPEAEVRFSLAAGGGVKLRATDHLAARFDGRVIATFTDASVTTLICSTGRCFAGLHASTIWQMDFTAGLSLTF
jgi:hypothetical protein